VSQSVEAPTLNRSRLRREIWLVLALSLGASAVYAIVELIGDVTAPGKLSNQVATLNSSVSERSYLDLTYQLLGIGFSLVPVLLALHFLSSSAAGVPGPLRVGTDRVGMSGRGRMAVRADIGWGAALAAAIGFPGLGLVYAAKALGINATIVPSALNDHWWTLPVLVLSAWQNAILEEVVVVGFLVTRLRELGLAPRWAVGCSAVLRGSYHLYQGFGAFLGNAVMGLIFGTYFVRKRTVLPLVIAHGIIDTVSFVGYSLLKDRLNLP
jgi:membrane protease YdiL (CAAX protease family)